MRRIEVEAGDRYGRWVIVREVEPVGKQKKRRRVICLCDCGKQKEVDLGTLRTGRSTTCGCTGRVEIKPGDRYGRWVIVREVELVGKQKKRRRVICLCDCGKQKEVSVEGLSNGRSQSCGCLHKERVAAKGKETLTKHGLYGTPEYITWNSMKYRCLNENCPGYKNYGGRGITICDRWLNSVENFCADMGPRPEGASIDRIDNSEGYTPENCRWATCREQMNNRRTTRILTYRGEAVPLTELAERVGLNQSTLNTRLNRGWTVERAVETKAKR